MSVANKLIYLGETKELIKSKINDLGGELTDETFREYAEKLAQIYTNLPKATGEGTSFSLEDTRKGKMVISPKGNTTQSTSITITVDEWEYGGISSIDGTDEPSEYSMRCDYIPVKPNVLYTIQRSIYNNFMGFRFYDSNKNYLGGQATEGMVTTDKNDNRMSSGQATMQMTINNTSVAYLRMFDNVRNLESIYTFVTQDTPSPSYPQKVKNVTGENSVSIRGKNKFNLATASQDIWLNENNVQSTTQNALTSDYIAVEASTQYKITANNNTTVTNYYVVNYYDSSKNHISGTEYSLEANTNISRTITIPSNCNYIRIAFFKAQNITNIQIEEGSTATPYEPYITPVEKELNLSSKNLFDSVIEQGNITNDGTLATSQVRVRTKDYINVKNSTHYILSGKQNIDSTLMMVYLVEYNSSNEVINYTSTPQDIPYSFITNENTAKVKIVLRTQSNANIEPSNVSELQLEQGSIATTYEPYYNYELSKIGNYQDLIFKNEPNNSNYDSNLVENAWYKKNVVGKVVFDKNTYFNIAGTRTNTILFSRQLDDIVNVGNISALDLFINRFVNTAVYGSDIEGIQHSTTSLYISINKSRLNTLDVAGFDSWLETNNLIIFYPLATLTYTQITESTLVNQLEELYNYINTNTGTLIIETESEEENAPLIVSGSALSWEE